MKARFITFIFEALPEIPNHWRLYLWNLYPPFLFSGIRIRRISSDFTLCELTLTLHWWNRNYIGTMFGGSIYSMCDPIHMVMLMQLLGPGYLVRDKGAEIRFLKKGTGRASARFEVSPRTVAEIWNEPAEVQERRFSVLVRNDDDEVIAEVVKVLHIRRKPAKAR